MQVDFHHGVTYVVARLAGFSASEADIIASSAQFVDDAVDSGKLYFKNGAVFEFTASAHKMLDYRNFEKLANHHVWIPFHFLPANEFDPSIADSVPEFVQKAVCRPNSTTAQEMVRLAILNRGHPNALYRLGIAMHVYADTWAHQGFAGLSHEVNTVREIFDHQGNTDHDIHNSLKEWYGSGWFDKMKATVKSRFVNEVAPVGHGPVLSYPDRPFLKWKYIDWKGDTILRNNPEDFLTAVDHMYLVLAKFRKGDPNGTVMPMHSEDRQLISQMLTHTTDPDGEKRHLTWLQAIADGKFSFGRALPEYYAQGPGSWQHEVFPEAQNHSKLEDWFASHGKRELDYPENFAFSHWKLFHDALEGHRTDVLNLILPRYGIVAA